MKSSIDDPAHTFELIRYVDLTPRVRSFECRHLGENDFEFRAGQFVSIEFTLEGAVYTRSYSVASPPRSDDKLELLARYNPGGPGTRFLWGMEPGFRFKATGPSGSFQLREPGLRDSLFVAIGTGIAPVRSMVYSILSGRETPELRLLYGVRDQTDLIYHEEFVNLARRHPNFSYDVILSRPLNGWTGPSGRVQEHVGNTVGGRSNWDAYLSGSQEMVKDIRRILLELGLDPGAIYNEKYE